MRNLGRAIAAFMICTAAAAALAQPPAPSAADYATAGDPAAGPPVAADAPPDPTAAGASLTVAPMMVTQVTVTPSASEQTPTLPTPPVAAVRTGPPPIVPVPQAVYVANFIAVPAGAAPSGLLDRLRAAMHAHAAGHDAGLVAQAVVQRLNHAGLAARYLAPGAPPPVQGWLIGGVFHLQEGFGAAVSDGAEPAAEVVGADVSVTVADLEHSADTPFAVIGSPPAASAESGKWHPYVVPARLSFERADRNAAIAALAQQIADAFTANIMALRQADARAIAP
ncbi:MAG: hypothetical protein ACTHNZ_05585 [Trinickia sp.]|uniref:hypothetical protein n=1 Tax=Trinickia sp. TaxID=2571163 RepID=UPI003F7CE42A